MKIIDLLNKIANGEEVPKKIKFNGFIWTYDIYNKRYCEGKNLLFNVLGHYKGIILNDEVEILEEKKKIPEKLDIYDELQSLLKDNNIDEHNLHKMLKKIELKQNEIIDYLDYLKSKGDE